MTHEECLNRLLSDACPMNEPDADGYYEFYIELHCEELVIRAKNLDRPVVDDEGKYQYDHYEIASIRRYREGR